MVPHSRDLGTPCAYYQKNTGVVITIGWDRQLYQIPFYETFSRELLSEGVRSMNIWKGGFIYRTTSNHPVGMSYINTERYFMLDIIELTAEYNKKVKV